MMDYGYDVNTTNADLTTWFTVRTTLYVNVGDG